MPQPLHDQYDHIIWDWNGTLLDDIALCVQVNNELLRTHGLPELTVKRYQRLFGFPIRDYYKALGFDFDATPFEDLAEHYVSVYEAEAKHTSLHQGVTKMLSAVKAGGKTQSVLTAANESHVHDMMDHFSLWEFFDHVYGICDRFAASKIERGHDLIAHSGIAADRTLLVGDTDHDHEVGEALGTNVLLVAHGHQSLERLRALHHNVRETLADF